MAGTIIADFIRADANKFSINVGNTVIASVNALGILSNTGSVLLSSSGTFDANNVTAGTIGKARLPTGSVLQVVQAFKSDTSSFAGTVATWTDISGLSATITPTSSSSKILCICYLGRVSTSGTSWYSHAFRFTRAGVGVGVGDAAATRSLAGMVVSEYDTQYNTGGNSMQYLDSPATISSTTYTVQILPHSTGSITTFINRSETDPDSSAGLSCRTASSLILMEIAG